MSAKKPLVVVTRRLPDVVETRMRELFDAQLNIDDHPMSREELIAAMGKAEVLVPTVTDRIDASVISQAGDKLKLIANFGTGVDVTISSIAHLIKKISGTDSQIVHVRKRTSEVQRLICGYGRAKKLFGWRPRISIEEGLKRNIQWAKENLELSCR